MDMDFKAESRAKPLQLRHAGARAVAKVEISALVQPANPQSAHQNPAHELRGRQPGKRRVEGQHQHRVDAGRGQQADALRHRREQLRRLVRAQKLFRVRVERDGDRANAPCLRLRNHGGENLPVTQVHAVEVADGGHAGAKAGRHLGGRMEN